MALIKCPDCGNDVSEKAKRCPHCGKPTKKNKVFIPLIAGIIIILICLTAMLGWKLYQKNRTQKIDNLLTQVEDLYALADFDGIEACYDTLDSLHYDTLKKREILEYDKTVYADAYAYYIAINDVNEKLHNGNYKSLRALIDTLKVPTQNFEQLEINNESKIGKYISNVRNNIMYAVFNAEFVNSTQYDLDYYLTSWGYVTVLETYTEELVKEKYPFLME